MYSNTSNVTSNKMLDTPHCFAVVKNIIMKIVNNKPLYPVIYCKVTVSHKTKRELIKTNVLHAYSVFKTRFYSKSWRINDDSRERINNEWFIKIFFIDNIYFLNILFWRHLSENNKNEVSFYWNSRVFWHIFKTRNI